MLRMICAEDSSKAKKIHLSPRRQAASINEAADAGLSCPGRAGEEDTASPEVSLSPEHRVEARDAGRNPLGADRVVQSDGGDGQHGDPFFFDQEWDIRSCRGLSPGI